MEKIFNFFRFTNQSVFVATKNKLLLTIVNDDGRIFQLAAFGETTGAEIISDSLVELFEISEDDHRSHQIIHVRNGNVINYNTSMDAAGVVDNGKVDALIIRDYILTDSTVLDEIYLLKKHKPSTKNTKFVRAPDLAKINEITGYVPNGADKLFHLNRSFVRYAVGVRNLYQLRKFSFSSLQSHHFIAIFRIIAM